MSKFFINCPIVAMVISILIVIVGPGGPHQPADCPISGNRPRRRSRSIPFIPERMPKTVEQAVATPIEQQMSGVDNMNYMYSLNANNGMLRLIVNFDVATSPNVDLVLTQIRQNLSQPQLPL